MRIVVWNARMAFARKHAALATLQPDIAVVPECGRLLELPDGFSVWVGLIPYKGLAVTSYNDYHVALGPSFDSTLHWAAPVEVNGPCQFFLLGLWAQPPYPRSVRQALVRYEHELSSGPSIVAGDFNLYTDFGKQRRTYHHGDVIEGLADLGLVSAYHKYFGVRHGEEPDPTHHWRSRAEPTFSFHIDYCFVPDSWQIDSVQVGNFRDWIATGLSDHVPITVEVRPR